MAKAQQASQMRHHVDHCKRISSNIAYALVIYTLMLIFVVTPTIETDGMSIFPYFLLVAFVGVAIIPCRNLERHWKSLDSDPQADDAVLDRRFQLERMVLWLGAIGVPLLIMLACKIVSAMMGTGD